MLKISQTHTTYRLQQTDLPTSQASKKVISDIGSCDLFVVTLITDNYPLNVRLFKLLINISQLEHRVPHPVDPSYHAFLLLILFIY